MIEKKETTITNSEGTKTELTTTVVFEKNGSISTPVVITTLMPKVKGVLIITNKINASTKISIINSISVRARKAVLQNRMNGDEKKKKESG